MTTETTRVLVLGASGMLGSAVFRLLSASPAFTTFGTVRASRPAEGMGAAHRDRTIANVDVERFDSLTAAFSAARPDVVINCVGIVKQLAEAHDPLVAIPLNAILPHRLARLCEAVGARLVHISTDCVFSGRKGMYLEEDLPDCDDLYGRSKLLGEVDYAHAVTLRTSIIGHETAGGHSLINWFLQQTGSVKGFTRAVFSGLPTVELARVIRDFVMPNAGLAGVYHVSAAPIAKYDLLALVAEIYGLSIEIVKDGGLVIDRSLDSTRFRTATGYNPPVWKDLIGAMHADHATR